MSQGAQFRQIGEQRGGQHGADAGNAGQQFLFFAPDGTPPNGRGQVRFDMPQFPFEPGDMSPQTLAGCRRRGEEPIFLGGQHLDELPSSGQHGSQGARLRIRQEPQRQPHDLGKLGEGLGIEGIGLRQPPTGLGEVAHLTGIDDDHRQACGGERTGE